MRSATVTRTSSCSSYSRLVPRKGMDTLIRASVLLAKDFPRLRLVIGGGGTRPGAFRKISEPAAGAGHLPWSGARGGSSDWLGSTDLMVMDCRSRWLGLEQEGFGIVFLNAASCGVAAVAGRSGGSHEAVVDGVSGYVVSDSRSVRALAAAMSALLGDEPRANVLPTKRVRSQVDEFRLGYPRGFVTRGLIPMITSARLATGLG